VKGDICKNSKNFVHKNSFFWGLHNTGKERESGSSAAAEPLQRRCRGAAAPLEVGVIFIKRDFV